MKKPILLLAIISNLLIVEKGLGAVMVTYKETAPTGDIVLSNTGTQTTSLAVRSTPALGKRDVGQTFTVTEGFTLGSVVLYTPGASPSSITRNFTLTIESFATSSVSSVRTLVSAQSGVLPSLGLGGIYITFDLDTPVNINSGVVYGFRLGFDTEDATSSIPLSFQGSYAGGTGYQIDYSSSANPTALSSDLAFYLVADPIPESSALFMAGLGAVCLLWYRRHRMPTLSL